MIKFSLWLILQLFNVQQKWWVVSFWPQTKQLHEGQILCNVQQSYIDWNRNILYILKCNAIVIHINEITYLFNVTLVTPVSIDYHEYSPVFLYSQTGTRQETSWWWKSWEIYFQIYPLPSLCWPLSCWVHPSSTKSLVRTIGVHWALL